MTTQEEADLAMATVVGVICQELSDIELVILNNVARCDFSPHGRKFDYEKVKSLFTEDGGERMHEETKLALARVVGLRLDLTNQEVV